MKYVPQIIAALFFLGLVATPIVLKPYYTAADTVFDTKTAIERHGFYVKESSAEIGVNFTHAAPKLDSKIENIMPQIASMGASVAVADFDNDGWNDFYLTNSAPGSKNALYQNDKTGRFTDVAAKTGVADLNKQGASMGAVWGDYDNDGFEDLLVYKWGSTELYKNNQGKSFSNVASEILPAQANINSAIWLDFDRDGNLDIFLGGYFRKETDLWNLKDTKIMPESFEYAANGGRNFLLRNKGDGSFEDITNKAGLLSTRWTLAAASADINGDGFTDLFIANDYGVSELYINDGGKRFVDISQNSGVGFSPKSGMNASFGDVMNDGSLAMYESNIYEEGNLLQGNNLWIPTGKNGEEPKFQNLANSFGVENGGWSWAAQFGDLNNDGFLDLFVANGYVSAARGSSYWYDFATVTGGNKSIISDTRNWTAMNGRSLSGFQTSRVWLNDGSGRFSETAKSVGVNDSYDGRAVALADLSNDGSLDVIVANQNAPVLIYKTVVGKDRNWIEFVLQPRNNRSAIGTRVTAFWDGKKQTQEIHGGSGYCSQNQRRAHIGIGSASKIDKIEVRWPDGASQTIIAPEISKLHTIVQGG